MPATPGQGPSMTQPSTPAHQRQQGMSQTMNPNARRSMPGAPAPGMQLYDAPNCDYEPPKNFQQNFGNPYDCPEGFYNGSVQEASSAVVQVRLACPGGPGSQTPDCNPEKTSSIRCKSPQDSHRGCQSFVGSSWEARSRSWGRRRAASQALELLALIGERWDSLSGSFLAVADEQECLVGSYWGLVPGWPASSSSHSAPFRWASFHFWPLLSFQ